MHSRPWEIVWFARTPTKPAWSGQTRSRRLKRMYNTTRASAARRATHIMNEAEAPGISYRDAGVDIDAGDELVERIKPLVRRSQRREVLAGIGGFGALIELPSGYPHPVLL